MGFVSRGFVGRPEARQGTGLLPPGQYDIGGGFPVLSAGPTPRTALEDWDFTITGEVDEPERLTWREFQDLPRSTVGRIRLRRHHRTDPMRNLRHDSPAGGVPPVRRRAGHGRALPHLRGDGHADRSDAWPHVAGYERRRRARRHHLNASAAVRRHGPGNRWSVAMSWSTSRSTSCAIRSAMRTAGRAATRTSTVSA